MENEIFPAESGITDTSGCADALFQRMSTRVPRPTRELLKALPEPVTGAPTGAELLLGVITAWAEQA